MAKETNCLTVSSLTEEIRSLLETKFFSVTVRGEISNFKKHSSGHLYFTLKDAKAQVSAVMFASSASKLLKIPKDGDEVEVRASVNVYPPHGKYQLMVKELKPVGVGELLLKLEQLKHLVKERGWFEKEHKKALPPFPQRVGIITSPTGAAIQDMLHVLARRFSGLEIYLYPVRVQGTTAAEEIATAIRAFDKTPFVDVLIVGRGGGSLEDLFAFNEECVAKALFECSIPTICAVGHETDHSIAEYVADLRAPTPSAAAELVIQEKAHLLSWLNSAKQQLQTQLKKRVLQERKVFSLLVSSPLLSSPYALLGIHLQRADDTAEKILRRLKEILTKKQLRIAASEKALRYSSPAAKISFIRQRSERADQNILQAVKALLVKKKKSVQALAEIAAAIDPKHLLKRGYSILLSDKERSVINSVGKLQKSQRVNILLSDGSAEATIEGVTND